jgi:hypothetical protein
MTRLAIALACSALIACAGRPSSDSNVTRAYDNPERVTIIGYDDDAMEPFITRDGHYLLFNNLNEPTVNTDLHFAERVDDVTFRYRGRLQGANTAALEGVATMDRSGTLYFVSTRSYTESFSTVYRGQFRDGLVTGVELVPGISVRKPGIVNFDVDVSPDGNTMYFVDGEFGGGGPPRSAQIVIAERQGSQFRRKANSDAIMRTINTDALEYAACISADGRSLFFNRTRTGLFGGTALFLATRPDTASPFGIPQRLEAITGFVEGAALSPDERSLYYHRKDGARFVLYRVTKR